MAGTGNFQPLADVLYRMDEVARTGEMGALELAEGLSDFATLVSRAHLSETERHQLSTRLGGVLLGPMGLDILHEMDDSTMAALEASGLDLVGGLGEAVFRAEDHTSREVWDEAGRESERGPDLDF